VCLRGSRTPAPRAISRRAPDRVCRTHTPGQSVTGLASRCATLPRAIGGELRPLIFVGRILGTEAVFLRVDRRCRGIPGGTVALRPHVVVCYYTTVPRTWTSHLFRSTGTRLREATGVSLARILRPTANTRRLRSTAVCLRTLRAVSACFARTHLAAAPWRCESPVPSMRRRAATSWTARGPESVQCAEPCSALTSRMASDRNQRLACRLW
jgi:hypothetical protein